MIIEDLSKKSVKQKIEDVSEIKDTKPPKI